MLKNTGGRRVGKGIEEAVRAKVILWRTRRHEAELLEHSLIASYSLD